MSVLTKRLLLCFIGILAGILAWPFLELMLFYQNRFSSYFLFSLIQGALYGLILGSFFGSSEGLFNKNRNALIKGTLMGALIGLLGGALGSITGQKILFSTGNIFFTTYEARESLALPFSRALALGCMGIFIGLSEGIRSRSFKKSVVGFWGGLLGGLLGGFLMEVLNSFFPSSQSRLAGVIMPSLLIGLFYGLIEKKMASGVLRVLNGKQKRKEFLINQKKLQIGSGSKCDIALPDYSEVQDLHALICEEKGELIVRNPTGKTLLLVNDRPVDNKQILKYEDVIKLGDLKMYYKPR